MILVFIVLLRFLSLFFFSSRRRHTRSKRDWSSDVCSSDLSCHIHSSLWRDGDSAFAGETKTFRQYLAGQIACTRELALFFAPNINSYKRYSAGSWAPTTLAWGHDNRTCGFRIVGHGDGKRVETRIPGGDVNPYLAFAAMIAAGLHGLDQRLELPAALEGNAYESGAERFPSTLREAIDSLAAGAV